MSNTLLIAAAGAGKTTHIVRDAIAKPDQKVLITTYTEANEAGIRKRIIDLHGVIPSHITIQTWFSFLLQHGVRPYQGALIPKRIDNLKFVQKPDDDHGRYIAESSNVRGHYCTSNMSIYSNKLSKFVCRSNEVNSGAVIDRMAGIYDCIYVDEVQDLAGYDLDLLKLLFESKIDCFLVGDPRQVTYLTHHERKYIQYKNGRIKDFIVEKCAQGLCLVDESTLQKSYRNCAGICSFSSRLYPDYKACEHHNAYAEENHLGIFLVHSRDLPRYAEMYTPKVLRQQKAGPQELTFGRSKGLGFDHVLIYPTSPIKKYLKTGELTKMVKNKKGQMEEKKAFDIARFYVALTRARYSVAIVIDYNDADYIEGVQKWRITGA